MSPKVSVGVIVPAYERPDTLRDTVESLREQTLTEYEVVVVDDGSESSRQRSLLSRIEEYERFTVIRQKNAGPASARNRGWRELDTDIVAFTDDDCVVPPNWLERLLEGYEDRDVAGVGGPLVPPDDLIGDNVFATFDEFKNEVIYELPDSSVRGRENVHVGGTANMSYRRSVLESHSGLDESFPRAAGEDADLKRRVAAAHDLVYIPIPVRHHRDFTWDAFVSQSIRRGRGEYHFHEKWDERRSVPRILLGLVGSPYQLVKSGSADYPVASVLFALNQSLSRVGELLEAINYP